MTIADETDEDAAELDDDTLLESYLDSGAARASTASAETTTELPEWPPITQHEVGLVIDIATLGWFMTNHVDWRKEMAFLLRAWVAAQATKSEAVSPAAD